MALGPGDLYLLRVYSGEGADGNATHIVGTPDGVSVDDMQQIAARLGAPDTGFVFPSVAPERRVDSFSPYEQLGVCTQTAIAAARVLREEKELDPDEALVVAAGDTRFEVVGLPGVEDAALALMPRTLFETRPAPDDVALLVPSATLPLRVGSTRPRIYCLLDTNAIEGATPPRESVLRLCSMHEASAICLVAVESPQAIRLRVFTTSLGGGEDAATGGAAAGLMAYLEALEVEFDARILVHQGSGPRQTRGELRVAAVPGEHAIAVGGRAEIIGRGSLVREWNE